MKKLALLLLSIVAFSCGGDTAEKPEHLLSEDDMVNIIYDINMIQAIRSTQPQLIDNNDIKAKNYIYKKYKTDSLSFAQNNAWYAQDIDKYDTIQKRVINRIQAEKDALSPKTDSVKIQNGKAKFDKHRKGISDRKK